MSIASGIRMVTIPRKFPSQTIEEYVDRLATALEEIRDTIKILEDTGLYRDSVGRIILDENGLHVFDAAGTEVIDGNVIALDSGHITSSGLLASNIADGELHDLDGDTNATSAALSTSWVVFGTATIESSGNPCIVWASLSINAESTASTTVKGELRVRRDTTTLVEKPAITLTGTDVVGDAMPGFVWIDTATAAGSRNYDIAARMSASTASMSVDTVSVVALEIMKE